MLARIELHIALAEQFAVGSLLDQLLHDAVGLPRVDVVRADQIGARAEVGGHVLRELDAVLVGRGTRVDQVVRELEALVERGIEQQFVPALDDRNDGLAAARHIAAEDGVHAVFDNQLFGERGIDARVRLCVIHHRNHLATIHATAVVDFLDAQQRALQLRPANARGHAGLRKQYTHP